MKGLWWLLTIECAALLSWFITNPQGMHRVQCLQEEAALCQVELDHMKALCQRQQAKLDELAASDFPREKYARQQLALCYPQETLISYRP